MRCEIRAKLWNSRGSSHDPLAGLALEQPLNNNATNLFYKILNCAFYKQSCTFPSIDRVSPLTAALFKTMMNSTLIMKLIMSSMSQHIMIGGGGG